jgi:type I restriction enzyme S subunit
MTDNVPTPPIDIRQNEWAIVKRILARHVPEAEVRAFGSRAKRTAKPYSDLDLAIMSPEPLPPAITAALADDFSESDLPWKVDIVDWAATNDAFKASISRDMVVIQQSPAEATKGAKQP